MKGIGRRHCVRAISLGLVLLLIEVNTYASPVNHHKDNHSGQNSKTGKTDKPSRKRKIDSSDDSLQDNAPPTSRRRTVIEINPFSSVQPLYLLNLGDEDLMVQQSLLESIKALQREPGQNGTSAPPLGFTLSSQILEEYDDELDFLLESAGARAVESLQDNTRLMLERLFNQSPVSGENVASLIPNVIQGYSSDTPLPAISPQAFVHIAVVTEYNYSRLIVGYYDLVAQAYLYAFSDLNGDVVVYHSVARNFYDSVLNALKKKTCALKGELETQVLHLSQTIPELTTLLNQQPTEPDASSIQDVIHRTEINRYIRASERPAIHHCDNIPEPVSNRVPDTNGFQRHDVAEYLSDLIRQGQVGDFVYQEHDGNEIYSFTRFVIDEDQKDKSLVQQITSILRSSRQSNSSSELLVAVCSTKPHSPPLILYLQIDGENVLMSQHSRSEALHNLPGPSGEQILLVDLTILAEALSSLEALDAIYVFHRQQ
ncbi:hypothetical protein NX722_05820 [Endozoicomonas gorgoniicola]|uniref:Uncharacterized protein n=1 Tax=Endozoicomonas gorgoniicola TaxID=1234144 RepID=A0ABT3MS14_9GAMM|nr:hypothetical protein [Endozoicomonas gorgoniicola]MCW7552171.1 hypothetical protein [Endozoicomonas gorgoniicola]